MRKNVEVFGRKVVLCGGEDGGSGDLDFGPVLGVDFSRNDFNFAQLRRARLLLIFHESDCKRGYFQVNPVPVSKDLKIGGALIFLN